VVSQGSAAPVPTPTAAPTAGNPYVPASKAWDTKEEIQPGFGEYTYLLLVDEGTLPEAMREGVRKRNLELIRMVFGQTSAENFLLDHARMSELNLLIVPLHLDEAEKAIEKLDPHDFKTLDAMRAAQYLIYYQYYDFATASMLLHRIDVALQRTGRASNLAFSSGPVLYSARSPLKINDNGPLPNDVVQDLGNCPDAVVGLWCRKFIKDTSKEHFWETDQVETIALRVRTLFESLGPELNRSVEAFRQFASILAIKKGDGE
jgi:hypothetical protein